MAFSFGGAAAGASAGSSFGPWGAAAGGVLGGFLGGSEGDGGERDFRLDQMNLQREFAQNGVRWRVADAQAAGIHPLFALGAQMPGYQPIQSIGDGGGTDWGSVGQNLSHAIDSTRTGKERVSARMEALSLERGELQNELLRSQIARLNQQSTPPTPGSNYLVPGQTDSGIVVDKPLERVGPHPMRTNQEPGAISDTGWARTGTGLTPVPSKDVKERIEDMLIPQLMWSLRNQLLPNVDYSKSREAMKPPFEALPSGATHWRWSYPKQEWQAHFPSSSEDVRGRRIRLP